MSETNETQTEGAPITLTEAAAAAILARAERDGKAGTALRVRIKGGGCSGVTYELGWEDGEPRPDDRVTTQHGATVVVDARSLVYLKGSTLDWKADLMSQRFVWKNPNAKGTCGCGESFGV
jgi:iron-sulfur cluster assembly protein